MYMSRSLPRPLPLIDRRHLVALLTMALLAQCLQYSKYTVRYAPAAVPDAPISRQSRPLPLAFVSSGVAQSTATPSTAAFQARGLGGTLAFTAQAVAMTLPSQQDAGDGTPAASLRLAWEGSNPAPAITGKRRLQGVVNTYRGDDRAWWHTDVATYGAVVYHTLYPGVDLEYDGADGMLKGTYTVAPGADPAQIRWRYEGAQGVRVDGATGDLLVSLPNGQTLTEHAPVVWQEIAGRRVPVEAHYALVPGSSAQTHPSITFALGEYDPRHALVIDPALVYGSYLGGSDTDEGRDIAIDAEGNIYIVGATLSTDFPGAGPERGPGADMVVTKLNAAGTEVLWSTYLGGGNEIIGGDDDIGLGIAVTAEGEVVVVGSTASKSSFPGTDNGLLNVQQPRSNGVLAKLDANGQLVYGTYLGINLEHRRMYGRVGKPVALGDDGNIYLTGMYEREPYNQIGSQEVAALGIKSDGSEWLLQKQFGAASADDRGASIAVGPGGKLYLAGVSYTYGDNDFPITPNAFQSTCSGKLEGSSCGYDGFVTVLAADGTLEYATFLGAAVDDKLGIGVDRQGNMYVGGRISDPNLPTKNAFQATCPSGQHPRIDTLCNSYDAFVMRLNADGGLGWSTYLGSSEPAAEDEAWGLAVAADGTVYLAGMTNGPSFPVRQAAQPTLGNGRCEVGSSWERWCYDAFVAAFTPDGRLQSSTFLGGSDDDNAHGIAVNGAGTAYVIGNTLSMDFPSTGGVQANKEGGADMFVAQVDIGEAPPAATATPIPSATTEPSATPTKPAVTPTTTATTSATPMPTTPTSAPPDQPGKQHRVYLPAVRR